MPKIRSIETVDQYMIKNNNGKDILLTVVGEIHDQETHCQSDQVRLAQFVEERLTNAQTTKDDISYDEGTDEEDNSEDEELMTTRKSTGGRRSTEETKSMLLLLEYDPSLDKNNFPTFGSSILREVFSTKDYPNSKNIAVGIDIRTQMIGRRNQSELYNKPDLAFLKDMLKKDIKQFFNLFVNNIFESDFLKQILENKKCKENPIIHTCLRKINQFHSKVLHLLQTLKNESQLDDILFYTKYLWACVMDLRILQIALCEDYGYDEIFVVVGISHAENIKTILSLTITERQHLSGCVDTQDIWKY